MVGIYKLMNLITGEIYIGQSTDLDRRINEHRSGNQSYIDKQIKEYGKENFKYEIIEECSEEELDQREKYYIAYYNSDQFGYGYNLNSGGKICAGAQNPNSKLTEQDVYDIRESYNNHERKSSVYERYKNRITKSYFSSLWEGNSWKDINYEVYTPENLKYYKKETSLGGNSSKSAFTDNEVLELRKRYVNESAKEIYQSIKDRCNYQTLQQILWGRSYKNIPIYNKKLKEWINIRSL